MPSNVPPPPPVPAHPAVPPHPREHRSLALRVGVGIGVVAALALAGLVTLVLGVARRDNLPVRDWPVADEEPRSRLVDGVLLRWEEHGEGGVPVVLVHGLPTSPRLWRRVIPRLQDCHVYAWELVGYGRSIRAGAGRDISVAAQARHLYAWMRALGLERAVLVGHDLGGGVVQRLAAAHPEHVAGLVLVDSVAFDNWPSPPVRAARAVRRVLPMLPGPAVHRVFAATLASLGNEDPAVRRESGRVYWAPYRSTRAGAALARQLASLDNRDTRATSGFLGGLGVPARVVWGSRDPLDVASGRRLATLLRAPIDVIEGARHFTPEAHPDVVASAIQTVVAAVPAPAPLIGEPAPA